MNNFIFQNSTKVYFGKGCVKEYLTCLTKNAQTILLAYGGGSIKRNGVYDEITGILKGAGKTIVEFSGIMSNPTYDKVQEGARLARDNQADMILAVGGGSTMDCCKAVSLAARYDGDIWEDFWAHPGVIDFDPLPLGVVVTVAGTGSECNGGAVITNEERKIKTGRDYPALNPRFALMDPTYTFSVPKKQMASGSFDILSHIMETYFSEPDEQNVSDELAEALMRNIIRNMRMAVENPRDYTARSNLLWDSTLSENRLIKLGKKCDFACHLMEHQLGAYTDCGHGQGMAVLHPSYYRHIYRDGAFQISPDLPSMSGRSPRRERAGRNWPGPGSLPWKPSSGIWAFPPLCGSLGSRIRSSLRALRTPAVFHREATGKYCRGRYWRFLKSVFKKGNTIFLHIKRCHSYNSGTFDLN